MVPRALFSKAVPRSNTQLRQNNTFGTIGTLGTVGTEGSVTHYKYLSSLTSAS